LLSTFAELRHQSLAEQKGMKLTDEDFNKSGLHPELGEVTLSQLVATWGGSRSGSHRPNRANHGETVWRGNGFVVGVSLNPARRSLGGRQC
jgi:hypothetical protein